MSRPRHRHALHGLAPLLLRAVLLSFCFCPSPGAVLAAGMDCAKAATAVEKTICANPALREADSAMADAFSDLLATTPDQDKAALRAAQRQWLSVRNACPDAACLQKHLAARLDALRKAQAVARQRFLEDRAKLRAVLHWPATCETSYQEMISPEGMQVPVTGPGVETFPLQEGRTLYLVQCDRAAYQSMFTAVLQEKPGSPGKTLRFPTVADSAAHAPPTLEEELVGEADFDAAKGELTLLTKARGAGDCGSRAVYAFPPGGDATLVELRIKECPRTSKAYVPPQRWPLVQIR